MSVIDNILEKKGTNNKGIKNKSKTIRNKKRSKAKRIVLTIAILSLLSFLVLYFSLSFYYSKHFFLNTTMNKVNVSNMSKKQAEDAMNEEIKCYLLTLKERNDKSENLYGYDIDLHNVFNGDLTEYINKQNSFFWPFFVIQPQKLEINTIAAYDETLLKEKFKQLQCLREEDVVQPVNAKTSEYGEKGFTILPESQGTVVKEAVLYQAVQDAITSLEPTLSLEEKKCYEEPTVNSQNPELIEAMNTMNKMASAKITYTFGDKKEVLDGSKIGAWLSTGDDLTVKLDKEGVKKFVDYLGKTYNTFGKVRTFKTSYGKTIKISGGDYGWWLDRTAETAELLNLIQQGSQVERKPAYLQTAQQYGDDDIGDTYVEINLTAQHLFFYKDGSLIVESDFVSGNISKNLGTPTGTYPIQYKQKDATLVGEDYNTPVTYWMPFNRNIGLHDATWRSEFGKDIYMTRGSHGCINLPPPVAKTIFEHISRGVPVVVYNLSGTESTTKQDNVSSQTDSQTQ